MPSKMIPEIETERLLLREVTVTVFNARLNASSSDIYSPSAKVDSNAASFTVSRSSWKGNSMLAEIMDSPLLRMAKSSSLERSARSKTLRLVINLPGSPKGAVENLHVVLPVLEHAIKLLQESPEAEAGH